MIPICRPEIDDAQLEAVAEVLDSGMLVRGGNAEALEEAIKAYLDPGQRPLAVSSGTAALHLALLALGIGRPDLDPPAQRPTVIVPAFSWPATANVVEMVGARPEFVDIECTSFGMAPAGLRAKIHEVMKRDQMAPTAIIVVHAFGTPADMGAIMAIASEYGIAVIEDAACSLGATLNGKFTGAIATIGCFSFHPRKILTTGEGGLVTTRDHDMSEMLYSLHNHGQTRAPKAASFAVPGLNYRITDFQAAMGVVQLRRYETTLAKRRRQAWIYRRLFAGTEISPMATPDGADPSYQSYVVQLPKGRDRDAVIGAMAEKGIATTIGTWHIPLTEYYQKRYGYRLGDFPVSEAIFAHSLTLPLYSGLTFENQERIAQSLVGVLS